MVWSRRVLRAAALGVAASLLAGCGLIGGGGTRAPVEESALTVSSGAFREGGTIPSRYTCAGGRNWPSLRWSGVPAGTKSLAIVVDDPDAQRGATVHWVVFNLDPLLTELTEAELPPGARQAANTYGRVGYSPPCPERGESHIYRFTVYALDQRLGLPNGTGLGEALSAISGRALARGRLTGSSSA